MVARRRGLTHRGSRLRGDVLMLKCRPRSWPRGPAWP